MIVAYEAAEIDGRLTIRNSKGEVADPYVAPMLNLLLNQYGDPFMDRFAWDLDVMLTPLFKHLGPEEAESLWKNHKCRVDKNPFRYELWYTPGKLFSITRYIRGSSTPEKASIYYLGQYFPDEVDEPKTVDEAAAYGMVLRKRLDEKGIRTHRLTSPATILASEELESLHLPRLHFDADTQRYINDTGVPMKALRYAAACGGKLWIEAHQLGLHEHVWHWDLRSAFSRVVSVLHDTRECDWVNCKGMPKDAVYGTGRAIIKIDPRCTVSPILMRRSGKVDISPTGILSGENGEGVEFMLPDLQWIDRWKTGSYQVLDAWWGIPRRTKLPYNFIFNKIAPFRGQDRLLDNLGKRMLNSIYGLTLQQYDQPNGGVRFGPFWNAMVGSTINSIVACRIGDTVYKYKAQKYLTQIGVDSLSVTERIDMDDQDRDDFKLAYEGPQLVVSSGLIFEGDKKPHGWKLNELVAAMKEAPDTYRYSKICQRRLTLGDAVQKGAYLDIGNMIDVEATVDLTVNHDRLFEEGGPRTGREMLSKIWVGRPIPVGRKETSLARQTP